MKKDEPKKKFLINEDLSNESKKPLALEETINGRELPILELDDELSIENPDTSETKEHLGIADKAGHSGYDWENIPINKDPIEKPVDTPKLFDEEIQEGNVPQKGMGLYQESDIKEMDKLKPKQDKLVIGKEKLLSTRRTSFGKYPSYIPKSVKGGGGSSAGLLKRIISFLALLFILVIIIFSIVSLIVSLELVSKDKTGRFTNFILSKLQIETFERLEDKIIVSKQSGKWISSINGFIYVVSGRITNNSIYGISHIKVRGEFSSGGKKLDEQVVYAGNTFSDAELETLALEDIMNKLQRENGDINLNYPTKLAGLNYDIKPDESVPFFIVFPSKGRVLGLRYNTSIAGFERSNPK